MFNYYMKRYGRKSRKYVGKSTTGKRVKFAAPRGQRKIKQVYKNLSTRINKLEKFTRPEKKHYVSPTTVDQVSVGQCNVNADAYWAADITPMVLQSGASNGRIGDRITLKSLIVKGVMLGQSAQAARMRCRVVVAHVKGQPYGTGGAALVDAYERNSLTGLYDYNCTRSTDTYANFRILCNKTIFVPTDRFSGAAGFVNFTLPLKLNHIIDYIDTGAAVLKGGQICLWILCDSGNANPTTPSSAANVPITAANSGIKLSYKIDYYYTDI